MALLLAIAVGPTFGGQARDVFDPCHVLRLIPNNLQNGLFFAVAFGVGRAVSGRVWGGTLLASGLLTFFILGETGGERFLVRLVFIILFVGPMVSSLYYGGLLSLVIAFFVNQLLNNAPMTLQATMPYSPAASAVALVVLGLAVFGFYASRDGQPLFGQVLAND